MSDHHVMLTKLANDHLKKRRELPEYYCDLRDWLLDQPTTLAYPDNNNHFNDIQQDNILKKID